MREVAAKTVGNHRYSANFNKDIFFKLHEP